MLETTKTLSVAMFPGQGSQRLGMGEGLFDKFPNEVEEVDEVLGYSIQKLCLEDPQNKLNQTQFTQVALYVVNALAYLEGHDKGKPLDFALGHSLGEYNALLVAGVFDLATGLRLVKRRAELMTAAATGHYNGAMSAVIGLEAVHVQEAIDEVLGEQQEESQLLSIANHNSPSQVVVSGKQSLVQAAADAFVRCGAKKVVPLKVSGAFHSKQMSSAAQEFERFLQPISLASPSLPVVANVSATPYPSQEQLIKKNLAMQIDHPVLWMQSIRYLRSQGACLFNEFGEGNVLKGLVKRI